MLHPGGSRAERSRITTRLFALAAMAAGSAVAPGCATQDGAALAKQACGYVYSSLSLYESSLTGAPRRRQPPSRIRPTTSFNWACSPPPSQQETTRSGRR